MNPTYSYGQDVKDASGKVIGQAKFDTATGKPLAAPNTPQTPSATIGGYTVPTYYNPPSTTTLSNVNKVNQVPGMVNALDKMSDRGTRTDTATGVATYADGTVAESPEIIQGRKDALANIEKQKAENLKRQQDAAAGITTKTTSTTTPVKSDLDLEGEAIALKQDQMLADMKANLDSETKALIDNIQKQFERKREEQRMINEKQQKGLQAGLLTGGVTGKGSRSQFTSISSGSNIMAAQETAGLQKLAQLDDDERAAIATAKAAQASGDMKILSEQLMLAEKRHTEKVKAAAEFNKKLAEDNAKLQERNMEVTRDETIADLYTQGFTDTASIMAELKKSGVDATSKEVKDALTNIIPKGKSDLVETLKKNGASPELIKQVASTPDENEAYAIAQAADNGVWIKDGTGITGEYYAYARDAVSRGLTPMTPNQYQDMDANRKKSIAKAGASGGGAGTLKETASEKNALGFYLRGKDAVETISGLEDKIMKKGLGGQIALEYLPNVLQSSDNQIYRQLQRQFTEARLRKESGAAIPTDEYVKDSQTYFAQPGDSVETLARKKQARDVVLESLRIGAGNAYQNYYGENGEGTKRNNIIAQAEDAKNQVQTFITTNPNSPDVDAIYKFYEQGMDDASIYEWAKLRGIIK